MKIVHIMSWYIPNMGYQENFLPAEQKKLGHEVKIITSNRHPLYSGINDNTRKLKTGKYSDKGVEIYRLPVIFEYKKSGELILRGLKKLLKKLNPDIVHVHSAFSPMALQAIHYQYSVKYKLFIDDHSHIGNYSINTIFKKIYMYFVKKYYTKNKNKVACLLPVQYSSKEVLERYLPGFNIKLLQLGANNHIFNPSNKDRKQIRDKYKIKNDELLIITSGKFSKIKDIDFLIKSLIKILNNKKYKLIIIGGGKKDYMDKLKNLSKKYIGNKIIFIGFLKNKDLNKYYNASDIGIWPGNHSIGVIEAVSSGLPVILPKEDIAYKILFENNAAIAFKRKNKESLLKSISLLSNKQEREKIRKNGLALIKKELSWASLAKKSLEYYSS